MDTLDSRSPANVDIYGLVQTNGAGIPEHETKSKKSQWKKGVDIFQSPHPPHIPAECRYIVNEDFGEKFFTFSTPPAVRSPFSTFPVEQFPANAVAAA